MNTTLTIKIKKKLRNDLKKTADRLGVPVTTIANALILQFVRDGSITLSAHPMPRQEKIAEWERISEEMDRHPERSLVFNGADEFVAHMNTVWTGKEKKRERKPQ